MVKINQKRLDNQKKKLLNKKFNKLKVIEFVDKKGTEYYWKCLCECGNTKITRGHSLLNNMYSCGCSRRNRLKPGEAALNLLLSNYKKAAKVRGHSFALTKPQFQNLTSQNCFYCNTEPSQIIGKTHTFNKPYQYNGIDRINNNKGYTLQNCVTCCKICNMAKRSMEQTEFFSWVKRISSYLEHKGLLNAKSNR